MAIDPNLTAIGSGYNRNLINTNFERIDTALQDALSRSGTSPNMMEADIDLNGNDLLNVGSLGVESITIDGEELVVDELIARGDPGTAATITVGTVTTGAAGTSVIITNVGDETEAVLNFTIPRGDTGASGAGSGDMVSTQNLSDVASAATSFANIKQAATESATGVVELATTAEAATGTDTSRVVTPAGLTAFLAANPNTVNIQRFTSNGTWTKPSSGSVLFVYAWGGGGSGGKDNSGTERNAGGGGGGARVWKVFNLSDLASTVAVTVGAGGAALSANGNGNAGGSTTFGSHLTAYGGGGGGGSALSNDDNCGGGGGGGVYGAGGTGSNTAAGTGGLGLTTNAAASTNSVEGGGGGGGNGSVSGAVSIPGKSLVFGGGGGGCGESVGGDAMEGGGGGGGAHSSVAKAGGTSLGSGNGGAGGAGATAGVAGSIPGGGGGGGRSGNSGAGARGELLAIVF